MNILGQNIAIAVITAILTIIVNRITIINELNKIKKEKINERRNMLYSECYELLEHNYTNKNAVFNKEYIEKLVSINVKMKLTASTKVLQAFKIYYVWAVGIYKEYRDYRIKKDPVDFRIVEGVDGEEVEIPLFTEGDIQHFEWLCNKYIEDRNIKYETIKSKIESVLNAMRSDLGNDTFIES